jgi:hypothetical protein
MTVYTLSEARSRLGIGRTKMIRLMRELAIEPTVVHARRQELSPEQFSSLARAVEPTTPSTHPSKQRSTGDALPLLEEQVSHLKEQLTAAHSLNNTLLERLADSQRAAEQAQQLAAIHLQEVFRLRQLLPAPQTEAGATEPSRQPGSGYERPLTPSLPLQSYANHERSPQRWSRRHATEATQGETPSKAYEASSNRRLRRD